MTIVFTLCSNNYLAQAITLGNSLMQFNPDYKFIIGLVDREHQEIDYSTIPYEILWVESIGIQDFEDLIKKYNIVELNTAVKPFYFQFLFKEKEGVQNIIFLDPDIEVYSTFDELNKVLMTSEIVIMPHFTTPLSDNKKQAEEDFLNSGLYNLGFIAIKNTAEGKKMITWWSERLRHKAFINLNKGLFTDQIWINFVPLFFKNVNIFLHPGYNVAYWNLHERKFSRAENDYFINETFPLVFYHFSGYGPLKPDILSKYQDRFAFAELPEIKNLFIDYSTHLFQNGYEKFLEYSNPFTRIKEKADKEKRRAFIKGIPFITRIIRIIVLKISSKRNLYLE